MAVLKKAQDKRTLEANVSRAGKFIEIHWVIRDDSNGHEWESYQVSLAHLKSCNARSRKALADLEACKWISEGEVDRITCLRELADSGIDLYYTIFAGIEDESGSDKIAAEFREWFEATVSSNPEDWRVQIIHRLYDAPIFPWGLVFTPFHEGGVKENIQSENFDEYKNFWLHSLTLAVRGAMGSEAEKKEATIKEGDAHITITIDAGSDLIERTRKQESNLGDQFFEAKLAIDLDEVEDLSGTFMEKNIFWYFFLRGEGNKLVLDGEAFGASQLVNRDEHKEKILLLVLDGDSVLSSDGGIRWLNDTLKNGRAGLVATETNISNPELSLIGWEFMKEIMKSEEAMIDSLASARENCFPMSLFYGVYCDPLHTEFTPPLVQEIEDAESFLSAMKEHMRDQN